MSNVKAIFSHLDCLVDAIDGVKSAGHADFAVTAPLPRHEIEELIYEGEPSPVRWFTLWSPWGPRVPWTGCAGARKTGTGLGPKLG